MRSLLSIGLLALMLCGLVASGVTAPMGKTVIGRTFDGKPLTLNSDSGFADWGTGGLRVMVLAEGEVNTEASEKLVTALRKGLGKDEARLSHLTLPRAIQIPAHGDAYQDGGDIESHTVQRWLLVTPVDVVIRIGGRKNGFDRWIGEQGREVFHCKAGGSHADILNRLRTGTRAKGARAVMLRMKEDPLDLVKRLSSVYGRSMNSVSYIPALALMSQMELGDLGRNPEGEAMVLKALNGYYSGKKAAMGKRVNGGAIAGHLVFASLFSRTHDSRWKDLVLEAADFAFNEDGSMKEAMPSHNEMSDAVFMATPILVHAGVLSGDEKYFKMARRHFEFVVDKCLRKDGIYRHSPLDDAAWGRGNGFPALGLAHVISALPREHPDRGFYIKHWKAHLSALLKHQSDTGEWRQVVDDPRSYREFSSTSMIGFSMARGVRLGNLDAETFGPAIAQAFDAARRRTIGTDVVDVCTGTGKQRSLKDYFNRKAIWGKDDRAGAMVMQFALEMHRLEAR